MAQGRRVGSPGEGAFRKTSDQADLSPSDLLTAIFCLLLLAIVLLHYRLVPNAGYLVLIYTSLIAAQFAIAELDRVHPAFGFIHDIAFPVTAVLTIFDSLGLIVHSVNPQDVDYQLIRIDYVLFGVHPTVALEQFVTPVLTDILQVAYSSYYFLPIVLGVVVRLRGDREILLRTVNAILLCFYLSYIGYLLFPALGPRYAMEHLHAGRVNGLIVAEPIQLALNLFEGVKRDAFPSGHTAIALVTLFLARRYAGRLFWVFLPFVLLLIVATVYCRYHYVIDVIAGIGLAIVTVPLAQVYYSLWTGRGDRRA